MLKILARLSILAYAATIHAAYFDRLGNPMPNADLMNSESFGWDRVDPGSQSPNRFNFSGNARVLKLGFPGTCGLVFLRSWDILGVDSSKQPSGKISLY